jgi:DNA processing protein
MEAAELRALLLLRLLPRVGDRRVKELLEEFGSARDALRAPDPRFASFAGHEAARVRRRRDLHLQVDTILDRCRARGIRLVPVGDPLYPRSLRHLTDPPPILFLRGDPALLRIPSVTIVGSRKATPTGRRTAERLARGISEREVPVLSGLALGIDAAAHRGALEGPGGTVAVLGSGPDMAYPPANRRLFLRIVEEGLVVSEFPPGEKARPHHFPRRNRILAALADTVVVVEAGERSGALITVEHALDLGREVYAVPGSVDSPQSRGSNRLLADGAGAATSVKDLTPALRWGWRKWAEEPGALDRLRQGDGVPEREGGLRERWTPGGERRSGSRRPPRRMPPREARARDQLPLFQGPMGQAGATPGPGAKRGPGAVPELLALLGPTPTSLEALVDRSGLPPGKILARLTEMELQGKARRSGEGWARIPE